MSTGTATVAPEPLQRRRQPAQTQPQHEHHRRSLAIKYDNDTHTPPTIRYYYPMTGAYVHFLSISTAPLNFFRASFSFSLDVLFFLHLQGHTSGSEHVTCAKLHTSAHIVNMLQFCPKYYCTSQISLLTILLLACYIYDNGVVLMPPVGSIRPLHVLYA